MVDGLVEGVREPFFEILLAAENGWHEEVHQGPELHDIVLQWRPRQQQSAFGVEPKQGLPSLTLKIFDILGFIENHVVPLLSPEGEVILDHKLIRGNTHMERVFFAPPVSLDLPLFLRAKIGENLKGRAPFLKLHLPVDDNRGWHDDQVRAPHALITGQRGDHRYGLYGFPEAHLIGEDAIQFFVVQSHQPV
jgi:hypothetical protein